MLIRLFCSSAYLLSRVVSNYVGLQLLHLVPIFSLSSSPMLFPPFSQNLSLLVSFSTFIFLSFYKQFRSSEEIIQNCSMKRTTSFITTPCLFFKAFESNKTMRVSLKPLQERIIWFLTNVLMTHLSYFNEKVIQQFPCLLRSTPFIIQINNFLLELYFYFSFI